MEKLQYYICFALLFGFRAFGGHDAMPIYKYTLIAAMAFFIFKLAMTAHSVLELMIIAALMAAAGATYALTGEKGLLLDYMMMLGVKGISDREITGFAGRLLGTAMFILTFLAAFGFGIDKLFIVPAGERRSYSFYRHCLGYPHTNTLLTTYVILMMLVLFLTGAKDRMTVIKRSLILFAAAVYFWLYCDSKTGIAIAVIYLLVNFYYCFFAKFGLFDKVIIYGLYPAVNIAVIAGSLLYDPSRTKGGLLLSFEERFRLTNYYMKEHPLTLFGERIVIPEFEAFGIDVSQIHLLVNLGIVSFVTVSILYFILLTDCFRNRRREELAIVLSIFLMGITDPLLYNLSCKNITFLFMGIALYRLTGRSKDRLPAALGREIRIIPTGKIPLEGFYSRLRSFDVAFNNMFRYDGKPAVVIVPAAIAVIAAVVRYVAGRNSVQPLEGEITAGIYEHLLLSVSTGVFLFIAGYAACCLAAGLKRKRKA